MAAVVEMRTHAWMASVTDPEVRPFVSIVIPAYDELENLRELLPALAAELNRSGWTAHEILIVLPSAAGDAEVAEVAGLGGTPIRREPTDRFGDAIRSGLAHVAGCAEWVVVMDADGSHSPHTVPRLLGQDPAADVVVASRYVAGGTTDNPLHLRAMSRGLNLTYSLILGLKCRDVSTSFKRYRARDMTKLQLTCENFDIVEEIFLRVKMLHGHEFSVLEVPDHFSERRYGQTKRSLGPFIASYLATLVRLRRQLRDSSG